MIALGASGGSIASTAPSGQVVVAYINGILTSVQDADNGTHAFAMLIGPERHGQSLRYETLYNDTRGMTDFVELYEQRMNEHGEALAGRFELLPELIRGGGPMMNAIIAAAPEYESLLGDVMSDYKAWVQTSQAQVKDDLASMADDGTSSTTPLSNSTAAVVGRHRAQLDEWMTAGQGVMLVAYSQGALFGNVAYLHAKSKQRLAPFEMVHIAPASSHSPGQGHTRVDKDTVLNLLAAVATIPAVTNAIASYWFRPAGLNGKTDFMGHGLLEVYLNPHLKSSTRIVDQIDAALRSMSLKSEPTV